MALGDFHSALARLSAPLPIYRGELREDDWLASMRRVLQANGRLVSVWGADRRRETGRFAVCAAYAAADGLLWLDLALDEGATGFPDLSSCFPCAGRMQRAITDLLGLTPAGASDDRPWLNHGAWPADFYPLRHDAGGHEAFRDLPLRDYPFVRVEGDGVHEIPVGPVHAGIIEPGHFRFSIVGEKVLRLEERLGYTHKGIERRFTALAPLEAHRLAGRVSGDSTVAYAWAYAMALESAAGVEVPERATAIRALLLERERIANHLGDLGALGNDAGLAFGLSQFSRLREDWQRLSGEVFGHRFLMDRILPGGVVANPPAAALERIARQCDAIEREVCALKDIYDEHAGLQDRFQTTGRVTPELAARLGLIGLAGRASGQALDLRADQPWAPYDGLGVRKATRKEGDVGARAAVRFDETLESLRLIRALCAELPAGPVRTVLTVPDGVAYGAGWVEGWRGEVLVALELADGRIRRCHCHDPSWQNWPVLEHAIIGDIVPDFPLINKSFNLSYSGQDL